MGASNQEMVINVHLNRMGVTGDGIAYLSKPNTPQEQHRTISAVSTRVQSEHSPIVSSEFVLPAVKETVCASNIMYIIHVHTTSIIHCDNFCDNLAHINNGSSDCLSEACSLGTLPLPPHTQHRCIPPRKYFPEIHGGQTCVRNTMN